MWRFDRSSCFWGKRLLLVFVFMGILLSVYVSYNHSYLKETFALDPEAEGACLSINNNSQLLSDIESGKTKLTYECFGAKGDGKTNDYAAIRKAHDFANSEYVEKGIVLTVYGTKGKTYYMGAAEGYDKNNKKVSSRGVIRIITNVDWRNANFIVDDYIKNSNGENKVISTDSLFTVTSPFYVASKKSYIKYSTYQEENCCNDKSCKKSADVNNNVLKNFPKLQTSTKNLKSFVNNLLNDYSGKITSTQRRYFQASQRWGLTVTACNKQYIREGNNANNGTYQSDQLIIDRNTGDILSDINWNYDCINHIEVYPIPEKQIVIKNGSFTSRTNNVAYNDKGVRQQYNNRNIRVEYTGNVEISNITHYLDETKHKHKNKYQAEEKGNQYYGFIRTMNASYVTLKDSSFTPHTFVSKIINGKVSKTKVGTYDLTFNKSVNVFLDNVVYACDVTNKDGSKNYSTCYSRYMRDKTTRWGTVATNGSKNVFVTNSKLNRFDAHEGIANLYIANSVIGTRGLTMIGKGKLYADNVKFDRSSNIISLRSDYGSTWDGDIVLNNVEYALPANTTSHYVVSSNNSSTHNFGYTSYFPNLYINQMKVNAGDNGKLNSIVMVKLYDQFTKIKNLQNSTYAYRFKGNIYFNNIKISKGKGRFALFGQNFAKNMSNVSIKNYGATNKVNVYYDKDSSIVSTFNNKFLANLTNTKTNTKFNLKKTSTSSVVNSKVSEMDTYFDNLKKKSQMPDSKDISLTNITLSSGKLNEKVSSSKLDYTATINADKVTVMLSLPSDGSKVDWGVNKKTFSLKYGKNVVEFSLIGAYGIHKNYTITILRPYKFEVGESGYVYDSVNQYLYTGTDTDYATILRKLNISGETTQQILNAKLIIKDADKNVLASMKVLNFSSKYFISNQQIYSGNNLELVDYLKNFTFNQVSMKVFNQQQEVTSGVVGNGYQVRIYYNTTLLDTYTVLDRKLSFGTLSVSLKQGIIKGIKDSVSYQDIISQIDTEAEIRITTAHGEEVNREAIAKTGDILSIVYPDTTYQYGISVLGDVTGDGNVTNEDVLKVQELFVQNSSLDWKIFYALDFNGDGNIKVNDIDKLTHYVNKKISSLGVKS